MLTAIRRVVLACAMIIGTLTTGIVFGQNVVMINASKDNTLYQSNNGSLSNGRGSFFFAGRSGTNQIRRGLIAFDVAGSVPAGATITSAQLTLHLSRTSTGDQNVGLHKVLAEWGEGSSNAGGEEGGGAAASTSDATWLHRLFNTSLWATAGGDFAPLASAIRTVGNIDFYTWGSTDRMVADVQDWLDNPQNNFGWLLRGEESTVMTAKRFDSKENPVMANRPQLTVSYTVVTSAIDDREGLPLDFRLDQNYPNPFNPQTTISFDLPRSGLAQIQVFNTLGQPVATLLNEVMSAGNNHVSWDGRGHDGRRLASGIYFYRLRAGNVLLSRRMLLLQ